MQRIWAAVMHKDYILSLYPLLTLMMLVMIKTLTITPLLTNMKGFFNSLFIK